VDAELNSLISDLQSLKAKADGETTLATLQADYQTLASKAHTYRLVAWWVSLLTGSEKVIEAGPGLVALENQIAAAIASAPAVSETADAQIYLDDMKLAVTNGEALSAPLPGTLLAITPTQLGSGSADSTLSDACVTLFKARWDLQLARWSAWWAQHELIEAAATPIATPIATATATST
jgi:hypothetical protein